MGLLRGASLCLFQCLSHQTSTLCLPSHSSLLPLLPPRYSSAFLSLPLEENCVASVRLRLAYLMGSSGLTSVSQLLTPCPYDVSHSSAVTSLLDVAVNAVYRRDSQPRLVRA